MAFNEEEKGFNKEVIIGLISGLFVYWAQITTEQAMRILKIGVDNYAFKMGFSGVVTLFVFIVFIFSVSHFSKK